MSTTNTAATAMYQRFHFASSLFGKLFILLLSACVSVFLFLIIAGTQIKHHKYSDPDSQQQTVCNTFADKTNQQTNSQPDQQGTFNTCLSFITHTIIIVNSTIKRKTHYSSFITHF